MHDKTIQHKIQQYALEQEIYWTWRAHQNWIRIGVKNSKYFQIGATIRKSLILFTKSWTSMESGLMTKIKFCEFFLMNFADTLKGT